MAESFVCVVRCLNNALVSSENYGWLHQSPSCAVRANPEVPKCPSLPYLRASPQCNSMTLWRWIEVSSIHGFLSHQGVVSKMSIGEGVKTYATRLGIRYRWRHHFLSALKLTPPFIENACSRRPSSYFGQEFRYYLSSGSCSYFDNKHQTLLGQPPSMYSLPMLSLLSWYRYFHFHCV